MTQAERGDAEAVANEILTEVVNPTPDRGKLRRACAALKGFLIPIAAGVSAGAGEGAHELARQAIEDLSSVTF